MKIITLNQAPFRQNDKIFSQNTIGCHLSFVELVPERYFSSRNNNLGTSTIIYNSALSDPEPY